MQPIGERLREARMRQGRDITEVEAATKIRAKYLRALENDEFSMLPGTTYVKSFLRTYAEYLGLDAHLLVEEFRAQHEPRGEEEVPSFAPPARTRPPHERRVAGPGMAISPAAGVAEGRRSRRRPRARPRVRPRHIGAARPLRLWRLRSS